MNIQSETHRKLESQKVINTVLETSNKKKKKTLMAESEEELRSLLMKVRGEWKSWLKTQQSEN